VGLALEAGGANGDEVENEASLEAFDGAAPL
jgi:hypothetical protein